MWEHVQEALGKGTILNDEVAESEQRGVLFIRRMSGIPPFFGLSYIKRDTFIHSFIYSAEFKMLCNTLGLRCWRSWSFRSENGTPIVDRYQNGSPTGLVEITHVRKGK